MEGNHSSPPEALRSEHFRPSETHATCGWKGVASWSTVVVGDAVNEDAAGYDPDPKPAAAQLAGRVAFGKGVRVE